MKTSYRLLIAITAVIAALCALGDFVEGSVALLFDLNEQAVRQWLVGMFFASLTLLIAKIVKHKIIQEYVSGALKIEVPPLVGDLAAGIVVFVGGCLILAFVFKQNISGLIVTGAGSAAIIGFALKDFAVALATGLMLNFETTLKIGDRVKILVDGDGHEGKVHEINWRNTVLMTDSMQTIYIPNVKISSATIINYDLPDPRYSGAISLEIDYDVSIESAERILYAGALGTEGVHFASPPRVRAKELNPSGITYEVGYVLKDYRDAGAAKHAILKSLLDSMRLSNISIASNKESPTKIASGSLDVLRLVQQVKLFSGFSIALLTEICGNLTAERYLAGAQIQKSGKRECTLHIVGEGIVSFDIIGQDSLIKTTRLVVTEVFGKESLISLTPQSQSVQSVTDSLLYKFDSTSLQKVIDKFPDVAIALAENLAKLNLEEGMASGKYNINHLPDLNYLTQLYTGIIYSNYDVKLS